MEDFQAHLLSFDLRLESQNNILGPAPTANMVMSGSAPFKRTHNANQHISRSSNNNMNTGSQNSNHSRARTSPANNFSGPCQLCGRKNHHVENCWYIFDKDFYPHVTANPTTYVVTPQPIHASNCVPDSGATHHATPDLRNLQLYSDYDDPDRMTIGNGKSCLVTPHSFKLTNILHVPNIFTNLLSVAQFSKDNNILFEFHPSVLFVKDRQTGKMVFHGQLKDALYHFSDAAPNKVHDSSAFLSTGSSLHLWHSHLGHPMM